MNWKLWLSETEVDLNRLNDIARYLGEQVHGEDWIFLEGELGAGKSTFVRFFLKAMGVEQENQGSPTFSLAHEYIHDSIEFVHLDLYRLKHEQEIYDSGIESFFTERKAVLLIEWGSLFPQWMQKLLESSKQRSIFLVQLAHGKNELFRNIEIHQLGS